MKKLTTEEIQELECALLERIEAIEDYIIENKENRACNESEDFRFELDTITLLKGILKAIRKSTGINIETNTNDINTTYFKN